MRANGMADELIRQRLVLDGWADADIAPIFEPAHAATDQVSINPGATAASPARKLSMLAVFVALFAIGASGTATYLFLKPPVVYSISLPASGASSTELKYGALPELANEQYYSDVKKRLIEQKTSFIDADLSKMSLEVYKDGTLALTVPILAKGKVGSWWETPAGIYKIGTKETDHFSSFGQVHMPYSMEFQGNFFIHGWPYYEGGSPVSSSYSGGCIRMATEDAKKVYDLAVVGMPVLVYNAPPEKDDFGYQLKTPLVSAQSYLVADVKNGTVLSSKNAAVAAPIASISKLLAALVATEYINLDRMLTVPSEAIVYTSVPRLKPGTEARAYDLLFLLLQESSNEAAETLASAIGRQTFVARMNEKAKAINLMHTVFSDPSGAKGDYSTPEDLFTLLRYISENRRFVFGITSGQIKASAYGPIAFQNVQNFNLIRNSPAVLIGGKIGQTREASETYAGIFKVRVGNEDRDIAIIVLGSQDSPSDVKKLAAFVHDLFAPGDTHSAPVLTAPIEETETNAN